MFLRGYLGQPPQAAPDPGEIIYARRGENDKWTLAAVEKVWRNRAGLVRIRVVWFGEDPDASPGERDKNDRDKIAAEIVPPQKRPNPVRPGEIGWVTLRHPLGESPLVKQVDRDQLPRLPIRKVLA